MKRTEVLCDIATAMIIKSFDKETSVRSLNYDQAQELAEEALNTIEKLGMTPSKYVNPKAYEDGLFNERKEEWYALAGYYDKYPSHYFEGKRSRPYEFYLEGWEPEDV